MKLPNEDAGRGKNPARDASEYFKTPITTLLQSIEDVSGTTISPFDVTQAYNLCSLRVKEMSEVLTDRPEREVAMRYLQENASILSKCVARDIGRASTLFTGDVNVTDPNASDVVLTEEELKEARDRSTLAQHALLFVAEMSSITETGFMWSGKQTFNLWWRATHRWDG